MFSGHGFEILLSVSPRQQPINVAVWMIVDDPGEDVGQMRERVDELVSSTKGRQRKPRLGKAWHNRTPVCGIAGTIRLVRGLGVQGAY